MINPLFRKCGRARGFSLMELLAVMSIMALLTTLAVTSYFGAVRGMTRRGAAKHFANTLILARQRACMENSRISVVAFNEITGTRNTDVTPSYVVCKALGRLTYVNNQSLVDEFTELDKIFGQDNLGYGYRGSIRLYNLTQGKWSNVYPWVEEYPFNGGAGRGLDGRYTASGNASITVAEKSSGYTINAFAFGINTTVSNPNAADGLWRVGDAYGIEAAPANSLPRNFVFGELRNSVSKAITITFTPDGRANSDKTVVIIETIPQGGGAFKDVVKTEITVNSDGTIDFNDIWK